MLKDASLQLQGGEVVDGASLRVQVAPRAMSTHHTRTLGLSHVSEGSHWPYAALRREHKLMTQQGRTREALLFARMHARIIIVPGLSL